MEIVTSNSQCLLDVDITLLRTSVVSASKRISDYLWSPSNISTALPQVLEKINNDIEYVWYVGLTGYIKSN